MKTRTMKRNRQKIYFALQCGQVEEVDENGDKTGEKTEGFDKPVAMMANVSPGRGASEESPFGLSGNYDRTILTANGSLEKGARVWIKTTPPTDVSNGKTADYFITDIAPSVNGIIQYAIKAVTK